MKTRQALLAALMAIFVVLAGLTGSAWAWGNITHFGIGQDLVDQGKVPMKYAGVFIPANVCPDLAWTPIFQLTGRDYIHDEEGFVKALERAAGKKPARRAIVQAWKSHQAADGVAHGGYVPDEDILHFEVEWAVDACLYYEGSPVTAEVLWEEYNVSETCCDPWLIYLASLDYEPSLPVYPWMVREGLNFLAREIQAEYDTIHLQRNADLSNWYLEFLEAQGKLPDKDWEGYYKDAFKAAAAAMN